jgi:hypothetical protein
MFYKKFDQKEVRTMLSISRVSVPFKAGGGVVGSDRKK